MRGPVAFFFLGEALLIPHLYPVVEALAAVPGLRIDLWISTSMHEALLGRWTAELDNPLVRLRRAPGFRRFAWQEDTCTVPLPPKLLTLLCLVPRLLSTPVAVCAEQTSLWLPTLFPMRTRFVKTSHGAGSMSVRDDRRRRAATLALVPGERERQAYLDLGFDPARIVTTGYVKAAFRQRSHDLLVFPEPRPVILYTPHWQAHRSSWPDWGRRIVELLAGQNRYNVILAPHQRLVERAPEVREVLADVAHLPHVHCDLDSFAMVDGSYTAAADLYLGDTSSQVIEFLTRPRPCVFLNSRHVPWQHDSSYAQWHLGEVVERFEDILPALNRASSRHSEYVSPQADYTAVSLGDISGDAAWRAAEYILRVLGRAD